MSTLYVAEFAAIAEGNWQLVATPPIAEQLVSIAGSPTSSNPFNATTRLVRVHCDAICSVAFGDNPSATTANMRLAANQTEFFRVAGNSKLSVVVNV